MKREPGWVLVADDDEDIRALVGLVLEDEGLRTFGASDGLDALEQLREHPTAGLVLLDIMMPRMDGTEVVSAMRRDENLQGIPIVIFSGDNRARELAAAARVDGVLVKPVDLDKLLGMVRSFTTRKH
ncbi:response regulator receiver protein [Labilithrix luteola]|uniref:Response regulator receiver protein n=1 Tax=Labilithrix luteola TaxID=1391654 RepID=A0A0K1PTF8_9BACT|nr:response regulator [Labilithrix luteola]AKU96666.1 response regulator receiver protein [Labilithrix luteola]